MSRKIKLNDRKNVFLLLFYYLLLSILLFLFLLRVCTSHFYNKYTEKELWLYYYKYNETEWN